jgi:hypothetical protein
MTQVTAHRYPLSNCRLNPSSPGYPTVPNLLSTFASRNLVSDLAPYVKLAHRRGRVFRVDELNSVTCQGHYGVSNTGASALWALDTLFQMTAVGVDAVNFHVWPGAPANQLFAFEHVHGRWLGSVLPMYYGLLMFARAAPLGSRLVRTDVTGPRDVRVWATRAPDHALRIVVINASPTGTRTVVVHTPGRAPATLQLLRSPSPYATSGVTIAGQSFGATTHSGLLNGPLRQTTFPATDHYRLTLGAGSAAMLTIPR